MKPLYVKVILYDPATDTPEDWAGYPIFDGIDVQIAALQKANTDAEAFIQAHENSFSAFGWFFKLFNK